MLHQRQGIAKLIKDPLVAVFDPPGTGKSRQIIEAAQYLFHHAIITCVLIVCPAQVKINWIHPEFGEISQYHQGGVHVQEIGARNRYWIKNWPGIKYYIVSYEYVRQHVDDVCQKLEKEKVFLVFDEASALRNRTTKQFKAAVGLRYGRIRERKGNAWRWTQKYMAAERCAIMNGSPTVTGLMDLWGQFYILDKTIIPDTWWMFRSKHCIMGGFQRREVIGYRDLDGTILKPHQPPVRLLASLNQHILCRKKEDILDLPPKSYTVEEVTLTPETWKIYKEMRQELIVEFDSGEITAQNAAVKVMRLSQITAGYLGIKDDQEHLQIKWEGHEKLTWLASWIKEQSEESMIIWGWFRHQVNAVFEMLTREFGKRYDVKELIGGMNANAREESVRDFHPSTQPEGVSRSGSPSHPGLLCAQEQAGGMGLNLARANVNVYLSSSFSSLIREQSEERVHRPGQTRNVRVIDVIATGPKGQRTIDHVILEARRMKDNFNKWTKDQWKNKITKEI